ncbi:MAG TPA: transposase [Thermodesulfobacteriota bacterium]|nr:transposase [Thermodesulfobacteriota bacterium]
MPIKFTGGYYFVSLSTTQGRVKDIKLSIGNYQLGLLKGQEPTSATLVWDKRKKVFYLHIVLSKPVPPPRETKKYVGVDLGINRIATASNGVEFKTKNLKQVRNHYLRVMASLQNKGTRGAKRTLRRLSGKEGRICNRINHIISKQLVAPLNEGDCIVFENLKHIRQRVRLAKEQRRVLHGWSFGQLINFCTYKAVEKGNTVVSIGPRNSYRGCSRCGHVSWSNRKAQALFRWVQCGFQHNSDLNASTRMW